MWRLANYIYRAFRNVTTHRCPQDIIVPFSTICHTDEESNQKKKQQKSIEHKPDIDHIIKTNQFSIENLEKVLKHIHQISLQQFTFKPNVIKPVAPLKIEHNVPETRSLPPQPTVEAVLQTDEDCLNTIKVLAELNEETMSNIENEMAIEALESGNIQLGIETLHASAKSGKNAAALYNLGICYERGIGVAQDRAKACDYYRQAAILGHINAQFNLTLLSNQIDDDDNDSEDEKVEQTVTNKSSPMFRFSFTKDYKEETTQSWNDYSLSLTKTIACLS